MEASASTSLKIFFWTSYPNPIILGEPFEQMNALVIEPVPGVILRIRKGAILVFAPFLEERSSRVFPSEIDSQRVLEAASEHHRGLIFFSRQPSRYRYRYCRGQRRY